MPIRKHLLSYGTGRKASVPKRILNAACDLFARRGEGPARAGPSTAPSHQLLTFSGSIESRNSTLVL